MLRLLEIPHQEMHFTPIGKIRRDLFANENVSVVREFETAFNPVMIRDSFQAHAHRVELLIQELRFAVTLR
jgi:hypothetical protein